MNGHQIFLLLSSYNFSWFHFLSCVPAAISVHPTRPEASIGGDGGGSTGAERRLAEDTCRAVRGPGSGESKSERLTAT